jgi:hypothetical protein
MKQQFGSKIASQRLGDVRRKGLLGRLTEKEKLPVVWGQMLGTFSAPNVCFAKPRDPGQGQNCQAGAARLIID